MNFIPPWFCKKSYYLLCGYILFFNKVDLHNDIFLMNSMNYINNKYHLSYTK